MSFKKSKRKDNISHPTPVLSPVTIIFTDFVPEHELDNKQATLIRNNVKREMESLSEGIKRNLIGRQLLSSDLGLDKWKTNHNDYWVYKITDEYTCIGIYGVTLLSKEPKASRISFELNGAIKSKFELDCLKSLLPLLERIDDSKLDMLKEEYSLDNLVLTGYLSAALIIPPKSSFKIRLEPTDVEDQLMIRGYIVEPNGETIYI